MRHVRSCWLRVLMTYYYMPSFYMARTEIYTKVWLCNPNRFTKLTDAFHLLKDRTENPLYLIYEHYTFHSVNADTNATFKSLYVSRGKKRPDTNKDKYSTLSSLSEYLSCNFLKNLYPKFPSC